jgi:hypothetical protein
MRVMPSVRSTMIVRLPDDPGLGKLAHRMDPIR